MASIILTSNFDDVLTAARVPQRQKRPPVRISRTTSNSKMAPIAE
jgi:hypothetical protein